MSVKHRQKEKYELAKMSAFEIWCWCRMLRILWTAKLTNEDIRNQIKEEETLVEIITRQKLIYSGHVIRGNSLDKSVMTGIMGRDGNKVREMRSNFLRMLLHKFPFA